MNRFGKIFEVSTPDGMKKVLMMSLSVLSLFQAMAQEKRIDKDKVPEVIISHLSKNYPSAKDIDYFKKKESDSIFYEAEFKLNRQEYNLRFSLQGVLRETEREIEWNDLPTLVKENIFAVLNENFRKAKVKSVQEVNPVGVKQYEANVKVKKGGKFAGGFYKVMFDATGKMLSIEEVKLNSIESVF